jgi:hypothetical protein
LCRTVNVFDWVNCKKRIFEIGAIAMSPKNRQCPAKISEVTLGSRILSLARQWKRGNYVSVRALELAHTLLDEPDFDAALEQRIDDIYEAIGTDSVAPFTSWLRDCASMVLSERKDDTGESLIAVNHLFVIPVEGPTDEVESLFGSDDAVNILTESFKMAYVIAPGETLKICKNPLRVTDLAMALPGQIRMLCRCAISSDPAEHRPGYDLLKAIKAKSDVLTDFDAQEPVGQRAFMGISFLSEPDGPDEAVHTGPNSSNRFVPWHEEINSRLGSFDTIIQHPLSWNKAMGRITATHIQKAFETEANLKDRNFQSIEGRVLHIAPDSRGLLVMALERDHDVLGPVSVPAILAARSGDAVMSCLESLALEIQEHEDPRALPLHGSGLH